MEGANPERDKAAQGAGPESQAENGQGPQGANGQSPKDGNGQDPQGAEAQGANGQGPQGESGEGPQGAKAQEAGGQEAGKPEAESVEAPGKDGGEKPGEESAEAPEGDGEEAGEEDPIERLKRERDVLADRAMRALAELENSRKRAEKDRREAEMYGGYRLARELLSVHDNLKRALETADESQKEAAKAFIDGVELTLRELLSVFERHGIKVLSPEIGEKFNPQIHEAMFESDQTGKPAGEIISVMTEGFMFHERLLRPAQVGVSSKPQS